MKRNSSFIDDITQRHNLAHNFRLLKAKRNLSNSDLSKELLLNPTILSTVENPEKPIKIDHVMRIANYFNVTVDELLDMEAKIKFV